MSYPTLVESKADRKYLTHLPLSLNLQPEESSVLLHSVFLFYCPFFVTVILFKEFFSTISDMCSVIPYSFLYNYIKIKISIYLCIMYITINPLLASAQDKMNTKKILIAVEKVQIPLILFLCNAYLYVKVAKIFYNNIF